MLMQSLNRQQFFHAVDVLLGPRFWGGFPAFFFVIFSIWQGFEVEALIQESDKAPLVEKLHVSSFFKMFFCLFCNLSLCVDNI